MNRFISRLAATTVAVLTLVLLSGSAASAADPSAPVVLAINELPVVIGKLTLAITVVLAGIATLFATIGGARYLMAGGDPAELERAKGAFKAAGIGYALAFLAPVFLTILNGILGVGE
jgi:Type IV secretion system pilin